MADYFSDQLLEANHSFFCNNIDNFFFFKVNTKYISSNVLEISIISRVRSTSGTADVFNV